MAFIFEKSVASWSLEPSKDGYGLKISFSCLNEDSRKSVFELHDLKIDSNNEELRKESRQLLKKFLKIPSLAAALTTKKILSEFKEHYFKNIIKIRIKRLHEENIMRGSFTINASRNKVIEIFFESGESACLAV